jgi:hypothetical protein
MIETIVYQQKILAILVSHMFKEPGIHFFTPDQFSQQLGYINYPAGKVIQPHIHNSVRREVEYTQEVLFVRKGKLRVDFYGTQQEYVESRTLETGDAIVLVSGGHGFEILEDIELFEVNHDRTRFEGVSDPISLVNSVTL